MRQVLLVELRPASSNGRAPSPGSRSASARNSSRAAATSPAEFEIVASSHPNESEEVEGRRAALNENLLLADVSTGHERLPVPVYNGADSEPAPSLNLP